MLRTTVRNLFQIKQGKSMVQPMSLGSAYKMEVRRYKALPPKQLGLGRFGMVRPTVKLWSQIDIVNQWVQSPSVVRQSNELVKLREYLQNVGNPLEGS